MKSPLLLCLLLAPAALGLVFNAQAQATSTGNDPAATTEAPLPTWEQLTPQQREILVAPLRDRWNQDPDNRHRMLNHAQRWSSMTPQQREQARRGMRRFEKMSPQQRQQTRALYQQMRKLDKSQREQLREQWKKMTPGQRQEWVKQHPPGPDTGPADGHDGHGHHRGPPPLH